LTKTNKLLLSLILVACMLSAAAFAGTEQDPQELLSKSFQQADLWNQGPVKVVAKVHVDNANGDLRNLQYTVSWVGPEKWRAEWSAPGLHQITILNNGKLSYVSNRPKILWSTIWFEAALAALDGGTPAGPYLLAPLAYENAKLHASKKKINETEARCLAFGEPKTTLCIDPASGHLLTADGSLGSFEYSNYTSVGNNSYPQTVKVSYVTTSCAAAIAFLAHGFAAHLDAVGVVHQTVEDAVGDGGIADLLVPARDRRRGSWEVRMVERVW
jgi:hypothetical protein